MKRLQWRALCTLVLGVALSACFSLDVGGAPENFHGAVTVSFDKNNSDVGSTQANPDNITIQLPATTLGSLPTEPTRPGYWFVEWNMQSDGRGERFTAQTPIRAKIHFVVYAQWKPVLHAQLSPDTLRFSPIEESCSFTLTVFGFKNEADANNVELDTNMEELAWLWPHSEPGKVSGDTKTFVVHVQYRGLAFAEAPATVHLNLENIPAGYEYAGGTQTLHITTADGEDPTRPIPVHQRNLKTFNDYASTEGLGLHYQLTENVKLEPPEPPKTSNWTAIGTESAPFTGSFDGGGHSISGLIINNNKSRQGLFGSSNPGAVIQNLGVENVSVSGENEVGGVVGWNGSNSTVQNCYVTGHVEGFNAVGGVVGRNESGGLVQNCYATSSAQNLGFSTIGGYIGGVVGYNNGGTVQNCYATGHVSGNNSGYVGGVSGGNFGINSTMQNCVALSATLNSSGSLDTFGRVAGSNMGTLKNNHARDGMRLIRYDTPSTPSTDNASSLNGADVPAEKYNALSFWEQTLRIEATGTQSEVFWDFENVWVWSPDSRLPILRNMHSEQNPTVWPLPP